MAQTMAEYLIQQGEARGEKRGEKRGEARGEKRARLREKRRITLKLLRLRFGDIPNPLKQRIMRVRSAARFDTLIEEAVIAERLEDIRW